MRAESDPRHAILCSPAILNVRNAVFQLQLGVDDKTIFTSVIFNRHHQRCDALNKNKMHTVSKISCF